MDLLPIRSRNEGETERQARPRVSFSDNRIGNNFLSRILSRRTPEENNQQLSEVIDVDRDIQIFQQNQLKLLNPKTLYNIGQFSRTTQLYRHYREEQLSAIGTKVTTTNLINPEALRQIKNTGRTLMHMGLIVIGLKGLIN